MIGSRNDFLFDGIDTANFSGGHYADKRHHVVLQFQQPANRFLGVVLLKYFHSNQLFPVFMSFLITFNKAIFIWLFVVIFITSF